MRAPRRPETAKSRRKQQDISSWSPTSPGRFRCGSTQGSAKSSSVLCSRSIFPGGAKLRGGEFTPLWKEVSSFSIRCREGGSDLQGESDVGARLGRRQLRAVDGTVERVALDGYAASLTDQPLELGAR